MSLKNKSFTKLVKSSLDLFIAASLSPTKDLEMLIKSEFKLLQILCRFVSSSLEVSVNLAVALFILSVLLLFLLSESSKNSFI